MHRNETRDETSAVTAALSRAVTKAVATNPPLGDLTTAIEAAGQEGIPFAHLHDRFGQAANLTRQTLFDVLTMLVNSGSYQFFALPADQPDIVRIRRTPNGHGKRPESRNDLRAASRPEWLTIPQICADLQVSEAEWAQWRERGETPLHVIGDDGRPRVRVRDFDRWIDSLTDTGTITDSEIRDA